MLLVHTPPPIRRVIWLALAVLLTAALAVTAWEIYSIRADRSRETRILRELSESPGEVSGWIQIGTMGAQDVGTASDALERVGIDSGFDGSVVFGIFVHPQDRRRAIDVLKEDSLRHSYYIQLPGFTHTEEDANARRRG